MEKINNVPAMYNNNVNLEITQKGRGCIGEKEVFEPPNQASAVPDRGVGRGQTSRNRYLALWQRACRAKCVLVVPRKVEKGPLHQVIIVPDQLRQPWPLSCLGRGHAVPGRAEPVLCGVLACLLPRRVCAEGMPCLP